MFLTELLPLLNEYRSSEDQYEKKRLENTLKKFLMENESQFRQLLITDHIDENSKELLKNLLDEKRKEFVEIGNVTNPLQEIKEFYIQWRELYENNPQEPTQEMVLIIEKIINKYYPQRKEVIENLIKINDDEIYQKFKNMVENQIRIFFYHEAENYLNSQLYKKNNFFKKIRIKKNIDKELKKISKYEFNYESFMEALKWAS